MTDLEVFELSAMACGHLPAKLCSGPHYVAIKRELPKGDYDWTEWNPFTNDSQRWECVKKLLETGYDLSFSANVSYAQHMADGRCWHKENDCIAQLACSADEFPARALAELESRKSK